MKQTVSRYDFRQAFEDAGRIENFSNEALDLLFEYLEDWEEDTGEELELDVIAICCDYQEDLITSVAEEYDIDISDCVDDDEIEEVVCDQMERKTLVVGVTEAKTIVFASF